MNRRPTNGGVLKIRRRRPEKRRTGGSTASSNRLATCRSPSRVIHKPVRRPTRQGARKNDWAGRQSTPRRKPRSAPICVRRRPVAAARRSPRSPSGPRRASRKPAEGHRRHRISVARAIPSMFLRSVQENCNQLVHSVIRVAIVLGRKPCPEAANRVGLWRPTPSASGFVRPSPLSWRGN